MNLEWKNTMWVNDLLMRVQCERWVEAYARLVFVCQRYCPLRLDTTRSRVRLEFRWNRPFRMFESKIKYEIQQKKKMIILSDFLRRVSRIDEHWQAVANEHPIVCPMTYHDSITRLSVQMCPSRLSRYKKKTTKILFTN